MSDTLGRTLLPRAEAVAEFQAVRRDEARLRPGAVEIARRHGLGGEEVARFEAGSLPVYAVGEGHVLKLYPPCHGAEFDIESSALELLQGRLPIPTPRLRATGELDGWRYVLMERLRGRPLAEVWGQVPRRERERLAEAIGAGVAALHAVDASRSAVPRRDWPAFVAAQRAGAEEAQRKRGLDEAWVAQIAGFLERAGLEAAAPTVLLHTELMREHLLAAPDGAGGWRLTGLIDFESALQGAAEAEFASVGLFVTCAEAGLLRRLLLAYGYAEAALDEGLQRRLMAQALLHPFSHLGWYLQRVPPPAGVVTLEGLAAWWWRY